MRQKIVLVIILALLLPACTDPTPPITRGLAKDFDPTPHFGDRVKQRFPIESIEADLLAELRAKRSRLVENHDASGHYRASAL